MVCVRVVVSGAVQGVWYRKFTQERARAAGAAGWVLNRRDGTVEAVLEGEKAAVDAVLAAMAEGPRGASVSHLDVRDEAATGRTGFSVR